ncbi:helix-turn-helix domain-containing protein [Dactylosporangium sp. AC04546]|uniref:winged helix-turn-helix transcriptional regulator n=1 Tax=Dactylosporangium sp. AC04546 TaxID=2862460 RepID=UPI001EDED98D|nr:helix-turn-helix domain-containing protein [Dactylosporangium sp. AC04546]WVK87308.1 helix-turn-helix domain-containing protein [Dactylosporangium sp. AC04546]
MTARTYRQFCGIAKALDVVGERWSLLIVRDLMEGPRRYVDLRTGLDGIATDMLATRLRDLEAAGVVSRHTLPPPAASKVYELTPLGRSLEPVLVELARWGLEMLDEDTEGLEFRPHWLGFWLRTMFRPEVADGVRMTVQFEIDGDPIHAVIADGTIEVGSGPVTGATLTVVSDPATVARIARDPAATVDPDRMRITGDRADVRTLRRVLGLSR